MKFFTIVLICSLTINVFSQDSNDDLRKQLQDLKQKVWELEQHIQKKDAEENKSKEAFLEVDAFQQVTFVDDVENAHLVDLEWGMIFNNFSLQAEGIAEIVVLKNNDTADLFGYYIYSSYLLTGEYRSYDKKNGVFGRPKPNSSFLIEVWKRCCGTSRSLYLCFLK